MIIHTAQEMYDRGYKCAGTMSHVLLHGSLGAGKTTWTKGYAAGLGLDSNLVHSPTFTYMNEYDDQLLHMDLYRLEDELDMTTKGLLEAIDDAKCVVIEWPRWEHMYDDHPWTTIHISNSHLSREVTIHS